MKVLQDRVFLVVFFPLVMLQILCCSLLACELVLRSQLKTLWKFPLLPVAFSLLLLMFCPTFAILLLVCHDVTLFG